MGNCGCPKLHSMEGPKQISCVASQYVTISILIPVPNNDSDLNEWSYSALIKKTVFDDYAMSKQIC